MNTMYTAPFKTLLTMFPQTVIPSLKSVSDRNATGEGGNIEGNIP